MNRLKPSSQIALNSSLIGTAAGGLFSWAGAPLAVVFMVLLLVTSVCYRAGMKHEALKRVVDRDLKL